MPIFISLTVIVWTIVHKMTNNVFDLHWFSPFSKLRLGHIHPGLSAHLREEGKWPIWDVSTSETQNSINLWKFWHACSKVSNPSTVYPASCPNRAKSEPIYLTSSLSYITWRRVVPEIGVYWRKNLCKKFGWEYSALGFGLLLRQTMPRACSDKESSQDLKISTHINDCFQ